ncbi:MAG: MFS transporter [Caldilineales bacterium]|nr:MFS transporter [Caldilineales bacterium]
MNTTRQIKRTYFVATALNWLAVALPLPLLVLIMQSRGVSLLQVGLIMGIYSLTIVLLELPTGGLADAIGRKKITLIAYGFSLASGMILLFAFSFVGVLAAMIVNGIGRALSSGALDAWFVDSLQEVEPGIDLQPPLATAETVALVALGAGTLLGGLLPRLFPGLPAEGTTILTPFTTTILASGLIKASLLVFVAVAVKEARFDHKVGHGWRSGITQVPVIMQDAFNLSRHNATLLLLLAASMVGGFALAGVESFWQPYFAGLLGGGEGNSLLFGVITAGSFMIGAAGNMLSIPLSKRMNRRYALVAGWARASQGLFLVLLALQSNVGVAVAFFWLVYLGMSLGGSPHLTLVNAEIPAERRSSMLSVQSLASYVGGFVGSAGLGYIAQNASISTAWILAGLITIVSIAFYFGVDRRQTYRNTSYEQEAPIFENS